jgi:hypothetical protein
MKMEKLAGLLFVVFAMTACGGSGGDDAPNSNTINTFSAPSGVTAAVANNTIEVSWKAVPDAVKYAVYMASASGVTKLNWSNDAVWGMNHTDLTASFPHPAGLDPDQFYYFIVTAINAADVETAESCEAFAKINGADGTCGQ